MSASETWARASRLESESAVIEQARRAREALLLVEGTRDCPTLEEVTHSVARMVALLEAEPKVPVVEDGPLLAVKGHTGQYSILVRAAEVHQSELPYLRRTEY